MRWRTLESWDLVRRHHFSSTGRILLYDVRGAGLSQKIVASCRRRAHAQTSPRDP